MSVYYCETSKEILLTALSAKGGTKSNMFWKMRRKYLGGNAKTNYDTITEDGKPIRNDEEAREHIARYYEDLYQARERKPENREWTEKIVTRVQEISNEMRNKPPVPDITQAELNGIVRKLKRNKAQPR